MNNYKKSSELGLEVIELEDQVLLVKDINQTCGAWILQHNKQYPDEIIKSSHERDFGSRDKDIIASTKQLRELPLLVIEDEDEAKKSWNKFWMSDVIFYNSDIGKAFKGGFEKAKETYKFTEEDLRGVFLIGLMENISGILNERELDKSEIESLFLKQLKRITKKELWIEVEDTLEDNGQTDHTSYPTYVKIPKITNNQIKAVWK